MVTKRAVGRPATKKAATQSAPAVLQQENVTSSTSDAVRTDGQREVARVPRKRKGFGLPTSKLDVPHIPEGYHCRWINDEDGKVVQAMEYGYQFTSPKEAGYPEGLFDDDNKVKILSAPKQGGAPFHIYLMKILQEYYLEDKELAKSKLDSLDNAIRGGKLDREANDGRYIPSSGISYKT